MEIITLQEYTDQYVSLYEGQIRNLPNDLALRLINKGVAVQHDKDVLSRVTSDDNGKILSVVNGKPAFVENSGGGGGESPFFIVPNPDGDTGELDLTPSELIAAMETGKLPINPNVSGNEYFLSIVEVAAPMDFGDGELYYLYYFGEDLSQPANIHATGLNAHYFADNY